MVAASTQGQVAITEIAAISTQGQATSTEIAATSTQGQVTSTGLAVVSTEGQVVAAFATQSSIRVLLFVNGRFGANQEGAVDARNKASEDARPLGPSRSTSPGFSWRTPVSSSSGAARPGPPF